jgi:aconitate hydratase
LDGTEIFTIAGLNSSILPSQVLSVRAENARGMFKNFSVISRLDSKIEIDYYRNGGILQYMLRQFLRKDTGVEKLTDAERTSSPI